uniref:NEDD4-binding protein 2-like 1 n=1 Tax=Laticauda laticaudata TaxID=8630 RepID=A0A8C5SJH4_LATLA
PGLTLVSRQKGHAPAFSPGGRPRRGPSNGPFSLFDRLLRRGPPSAPEKRGRGGAALPISSHAAEGQCKRHLVTPKGPTVARDEEAAAAAAAAVVSPLWKIAWSAPSGASASSSPDARKAGPRLAASARAFICSAVCPAQAKVLWPAHKAMKKGKSPIIIDNTNIHAWEMKPYAIMALENRYEVIFREPDTHWKFHVRELARRNHHGVPFAKIRWMKDEYEHNVTFHTVLHSEEPARYWNSGRYSRLNSAFSNNRMNRS